MVHAGALKTSFSLLVVIVVKKKIEMWFSLVCTLIDNDTGHHSGQNFLWTQKAQSSESTTFRPLWRRVLVVDKSTDHAKPHLICKIDIDNDIDNDWSISNGYLKLLTIKLNGKTWRFWTVLRTINIHIYARKKYKNLQV